MSASPIERLNAALEDRYRIERPLGEGGMATVYLARDLKHNRNVALKVLKPELAAVVGADRFLAEIETTANLQHPHILPLFDSGEADGFLFYVMPYLEGESLRDRLDREHQLPVDEALQIARNVAEALDYAHRHGVIHRDVKPANILLQDGKPVVSDFGIALAVTAGGAGRLTETGLSLGTPHYMSPEQATGDLSVGAATDIYALACVLYEMLVAEPPYTGGTPQAVLGKIVTGDADPVSKHRRAVPANVDGAIRKALEKVPADRFAVAADFAKALGDPGFRYGAEVATAAAAGAGRWKVASLVLGAVAVASTAALGWALTRPSRALPIARFESPFRPGQEPRDYTVVSYSLAPDGSFLVYRGLSTREVGPAQSPLAQLTLWVRRWDDPEATELPGTEGADLPAVSPDARVISFDQGGEVKVISADGGPVATLARGNFHVWGPDGFVYFRTPEWDIMRVPGTGGTPEPVRPLGEGEQTQLLFDFLPGGSRALIMTRTAVEAPFEMAVFDVATGETTALTSGQAPKYASTGHLVFWSDGSLMAARLDARTLELGPAVALVDDVLSFTLSQTGLLAYSTGAGEGGVEVEPVWVTRAGAAEVIDPEWRFEPGFGVPGSHGWRLSPDGTRLAVTRVVDGNEDIWIKRLPDGPFDRITFSEDPDNSPAWTPDGAFVSYDRSQRSLLRSPSDGAGREEVLIDSVNMQQARWGPDGSWVVARTFDIAAARLGASGVEDSVRFETGFLQRGPALSPDGRWLAYSSDRSGREEVYVRPFPDVASGREQVSVNGGSNPVWAHSGRELFYIDAAKNLVAASVVTAPRFAVSGREVLFAIRPELAGNGLTDGGDDFYDVSPDGQRFLMGRIVGEAEEADPMRLVLVQNFFEELRRRVPN